MRRGFSVAIVATLLLGALSFGMAHAKEILRVTLSGPFLDEAVQITDPDDLAIFTADFPYYPGGGLAEPLDDPGTGFPVWYNLRVVMDARPHILGTYYPDPAGGRGILYLEYGAGSWFRVTPAFDALMAKYGAVLPPGLPVTGGESSVHILALLFAGGVLLSFGLVGRLGRRSGGR